MRTLIIIFFFVVPLVYSNDMEAQLVTYVSRSPLFEGDLNAFVMNPFTIRSSRRGIQ